MKKTILIAAIISFFSVVSYAQDGQHQRPTPQEMEQRRNAMYDSLGLAKDQREKMTALDQDNRAKMQAIRSDESLTEDLQKEKMMQLRTETKAKRDAILTPEQLTKFEAMMQKMRGSRPPRN
jgi:Spy/CpxP family protein refolding chaperone